MTSTNPNRRRSAVSSRAIDRSAVFIVPITYTLSGTVNGSPDSGNRMACPRLSRSSTVSNSPKMRGMSPRLISSTIRKKPTIGLPALASSHSCLKIPSRRSNAIWPRHGDRTVTFQEVLVAVGRMERVERTRPAITLPITLIIIPLVGHQEAHRMAEPNAAYAARSTAANPPSRSCPCQAGPVQDYLPLAIQHRLNVPGIPSATKWG